MNFAYGRAGTSKSRARTGSILDHATVAHVLRLAGIEPPSDPKKLMKCPLHDDGTASFKMFDRGFCCFGCGAKGGIFDLTIALGLARDRAEAASYLEARVR